MYYSSGNYEAFAHPLPPEGVENKQAYIIGSGLAGLAAACFLVRDGRMPGEKIHVLSATCAPAAVAMAGSTRGSASPCAAAARWTTTSR